ncbi:MAG: hypothetical protein ACTHWA_12270 [Arachnia sp.]
MLNGTLFASSRTAELTDACLMRMDTGLPFPYPPKITEQAPWASEVAGIAMLLAIASWVVLILGLRLSRGTTGIALIAAVTPAVVAVMGLLAAQDRGRDPQAYISGWLWISVEAVAVAVMVVLWLRHTDIQSARLPGLAIVLWGATAFGMAHGISEYMAMLMFNQNNWDTPAGTGWITVAVLMIAGAASLWFGSTADSTGRQVEVLGV